MAQAAWLPLSASTERRSEFGTNDLSFFPRPTLALLAHGPSIDDPPLIPFPSAPSYAPIISLFLNLLSSFPNLS